MTLADDLSGYTARFVSTNGITLHVLEGGKADGPLVILLHGFPEMHLAWRHQLQPLARAGFRVLAPDLRGYNLSDKPTDVAAYSLDNVIGDVVGLIDGEKRERAHVVGHDWGGAAAWHLAMHRPERLDKLVVLNSPHPALFVKRLLSVEQLTASWYMFLFQVPVLPEWLMRDPADMEHVFRSAPRIKGAYDDDDMAAYRAAWAQPRALTSMLNWYRASGRALTSGGARGGAVTARTLVMWGMDDDALPAGNLEGLERYVNELEIVRVPNCSHWIMHDAHKLVSERIVRFLGA